MSTSPSTSSSPTSSHFASFLNATFTRRRCRVCGGPVELSQRGTSDHDRCLNCYAEAMQRVDGGRPCHTHVSTFSTSLRPQYLSEAQLDAIKKHNQRQRRLRLLRKAAQPPKPPKPIETVATAMAKATEHLNLTQQLMERYST